jgi:hypothetical protein
MDRESNGREWQDNRVFVERVGGVTTYVADAGVCGRRLRANSVGREGTVKGLPTLALGR